MCAKKLVLMFSISMFLLVPGWVQSGEVGDNYAEILTPIVSQLLLDPLKPNELRVFRVSDECVRNGGTTELHTVLTAQHQNLFYSWRFASGDEGEGNLTPFDGGKKAVYAAPVSGSGEVLVEVYAVHPGGLYRDYVRLFYGGCPNRAVFYRISGSYTQPGLDANCDTIVDGFGQFELTNDNENGDGVNPDTKLDSYWGPTEGFLNDKIIESVSDTRGMPTPGGGCAKGDFPAKVVHISRASTEDEGPINFLSALDARAVCAKFEDGTPGCSIADTSTELYFVFEITVDRAMDYRLEASVGCSGKSGVNPVPAIMNVVYRYIGNSGTLVQSVIDSFFSPPCNDNNSSVEIDRTVKFYAPSHGGVDRVAVHFIAFNNATADPETDGINVDESIMAGTVQVAPVN